MSYKYLLGLLCLCSSICSATETKEIILNNEPISIVMEIDEEIQLVFPMSVIDIDMDEKTHASLKSFLNPNGTALFEPKSAFKSSRAIFTLSDGSVHLIDLSVGKKATAKVINFVTPLQVKQRVKKQVLNDTAPKTNLPPFLLDKYSNDGVKVDNNAVAKKQISYVDMAQFAFRHFTGPSNLINNINATSLKTTKPSVRLLRVWQDRVRFKVLRQWQRGSNYITAISVKNISNIPLKFDPRAIRGRYLFVSTLHAKLTPSGTPNDQTVWVFISNTPFNQAIKL